MKRIVTHMSIEGTKVSFESVSSCPQNADPIEKWRWYILANLDAQYATFRNKVEDSLSREV